jgi:hypothetical protein
LPADKLVVDGLLRTAECLLEAAVAAVDSGHTPSQMSILVDSTGHIRMIAGSDWPLDSLGAYHGARLACRVTERDGRVRVEGRSGGRLCVLEVEEPRVVARRLLAQLEAQSAPRVVSVPQLSSPSNCALTRR